MNRDRSEQGLWGWNTTLTTNSHHIKLIAYIKHLFTLLHLGKKCWTFFSAPAFCFLLFITLAAGGRFWCDLVFFCLIWLCSKQIGFYPFGCCSIISWMSNWVNVERNVRHTPRKFAARDFHHYKDVWILQNLVSCICSRDMNNTAVVSSECLRFFVFFSLFL